MDTLLCKYEVHPVTASCEVVAMMLVVRMIVALKQSKLTNQDSRHIYKTEYTHHSSDVMVMACCTVFLILLFPTLLKFLGTSNSYRNY